MGLTVSREYLGEWQVVGLFEPVGPADDARTSQCFRYAKSYLQAPNAQPISISLPLRPEAFSTEEYGPFFGGVLPEGKVRTELAHRHQLLANDYLGLLERIGGECVGALSFTTNGTVPSQSHASYEVLTTDVVERLMSEEPSAAPIELERSRLSLAGAQTKVGWFLPADEDPASASLGLWRVPRGSSPSTHVIKFGDSSNALLRENEYLCMELARACGLRVARISMLPFSNRSVAVERFDRLWKEGGHYIDGVQVPLRLHQEDFCQMLGWPAYLKYETSAETNYMRIAGELLSHHASNVLRDKTEFARHIIIDYIIGNCDNHFKNYSILYSPSWNAKQLSPAYDLVSTTLLGCDRNMCVFIGDHRNIDDISINDFRLMAEDLGLPQRKVLEECDRLARRADEWLRAVGIRDDTLGYLAKQLLTDAQRRLGTLYMD